MQSVKDNQSQKSVQAGVCVLMVLTVGFAIRFTHPRQAKAESAGPGVTHIAISDTVLQPQVERLGINLGQTMYFDASVLLKNLVARNPGFEGGTYRSILRCVHADTARCEDDDNGSAWGQDFWRGATYEWITGPLEGRTGRVSGSSRAIHDKTGAVLQLADGGGWARGEKTAAYLVVRQDQPGNAATGWWTDVHGGATLTTEMQDLSPHTVGKQALRMNVQGADASATVMAYFDTLEGHAFLRMHGRYRLSFRAKVVGTGTVHVSLDRIAQPGVKFLAEDVPLQAKWQDLHLEFEAKEAMPVHGPMRLLFSAAHATVLLDDVSLERIDGDVANTTAFRDEVVETLREYRPGVLRFMDAATGLGSSVQNMIAPQGARVRAGYSAWHSEQEEVGYSLPEFLGLCAAVHADPWIVVPAGISASEMQQLVQYLSSAEKGRAAWSARFGRIHLELGNETWNALFKGETIEYPEEYGHRVSVLFHAARQSKGYDAKKFDLLAGGQYGWPQRNQAIMTHVQSADAMAIAPYLLHNVPANASTDAVFSALLAQPEQMIEGGLIAQDKAVAKPLALSIYETNLHTTEGSPAQATLDAVVPSIGAGVAMASQMLQSMRAGVRSQAMFTLAQWRFKRDDGLHVPLWGSVVDMGMTNRRRPQFLAAELVNTALHGAMVATAQSGSNPTWSDTSGIDGVNFKNAHMLQSFAFRDGAKRSVVLINLSRGAGLAVDFTGAVQPQGRVEISQMTAAKITDSNEDVERVKITSSVESFGAGKRVTVPAFSVMVLKWSER